MSTPTRTQTRTQVPAAVSDPGTRIRLGALAAGLVGWAAVSTAQAATRAGFDILVHPLSLLSTGDLGWLQITNFVVAGVLTVVGAGGLRQALRGTHGGVWAPRLVAASGVGLVLAGAMVMDPGANFPVGAPADLPLVTWHAYGHMVAGTITFTTLIAACCVLGRHFSRGGRRDLAVVSRAAGLALVAGWGWAMAGGAGGTLTLAIGAIAAMVWVAAVALRLRRTV
ncbi:hypothetical protein Acsp06_09540 [Actinomycetospora sp. NBRC 106375]|uniref:DUF998 domain-containing protein n=1 Tax=Actinomycetospora sp. NBRC 106375 TaxID=3032207 RepID=UPI0024A23A5B|nr:DUF998 domain-containing protein [Actinomycetospora sp. NBRC 106375]GLZ44769.1 hypothetical protein Acsp06_09540 [Actinomycetospora sp. NBRC 106375]